MRVMARLLNIPSHLKKRGLQMRSRSTMCRMVQHASPVAKVVPLVVMLAMASTACRSTGMSRGSYGTQGRASLTSIDVALPPTSALQARNQRVSELIGNQKFGSRISIQPSDASCAGATKVDQVSPFEASMKLALSIRQGCDYLVKLELGEMVSPSSLSSVLFHNEPALRIAKADINGKASFQANIVLKAFSAQPGVPDSDPQSAPFPSDKDATFMDANGVTSSISKIFKGEYLLLDFSQPGCGACVQMAQEHANDQEFIAAFASEGAKCSSATVVPQSQRSGWQSLFPASSALGRHAVFPSGGFSDVASKFGQRITATPTFMLIDRSGNVVGKSAGELPAQAKQLCK
jgi:hypothetical protein